MIPEACVICLFCFIGAGQVLAGGGSLDSRSGGLYSPVQIDPQPHSRLLLVLNSWVGNAVVCNVGSYFEGDERIVEISKSLAFLLRINNCNCKVPLIL